jgi:hypothetical protein
MVMVVPVLPGDYGATPPRSGGIPRLRRGVALDYKMR